MMGLGGMVTRFLPLIVAVNTDGQRTAGTMGAFRDLKMADERVTFTINVSFPLSEQEPVKLLAGLVDLGAGTRKVPFKFEDLDLPAAGAAR